MPNVKLYTARLSPPGRAVELTAALLDLPLDIIPINLLAGDHRTAEFLKMNPQHTIPVIDDDGVIIRDSHAIIIYLVLKYGKDHGLYPDDPVTRARINAALHFDSGVLFSRLRFYFEPILYEGSSAMPQEKIEYMQKGYELLNDALLEDYIVGNTLTLADVSCIATVATMEEFFPMERSKYPKLVAWIDRVSRNFPQYDQLNQAGAVEFAEMCESLRVKNATKVVGAGWRRNVTFISSMASSSMVLYYDEVSPPVRSVLMAIAALGIKDRFKLEYVDLFRRGHLTSEFLKINPMHTIPVLQHGDLKLTDSHAILVYLCDMFAPEGHPLAIGDTQTRAKVLNRLCFNNGFLFQRDADVMRRIFSREITDVKQHLQPIAETVDALEQFLKESRYTALDRLSVADFSIVATLSTLNLLVPVTAERWPRVFEWFEEMQKLPYYSEQNSAGLEKMRKMLSITINL
ncbi:uncharacterized protein LOC128722449 [Anopheles nili]|uniref:uncharacterized protein LOC128722449 n=1 Tax=Anopheles nili TaxID=185578 RepID=UPI00237A13F1|nr:uncharacterized protein LOC128722449 [Anopheles nili]